MNEPQAEVNICASRNWLEDIVDAKTQLKLVSTDIVGEPFLIRESQFRAYRMLNWLGELLRSGMSGERASLLMREVDDVCSRFDGLRERLAEVEAEEKAPRVAPGPIREALD